MNPPAPFFFILSLSALDVFFKKVGINLKDLAISLSFFFNYLIHEIQVPFGFRNKTQMYFSN